MNIRITGRHVDVPTALRSYAEEKASKFERYYDRVQSAEVVFDMEAGKTRCEIIVRADRQMTFVAKENHDDAYASLDAAVRDLERQLTRYKEKHRNRKHLTDGSSREPLGGVGGA